MSLFPTTNRTDRFNHSFDDFLFYPSPALLRLHRADHTLERLHHAWRRRQPPPLPLLPYAYHLACCICRRTRLTFMTNLPGVLALGTKARLDPRSVIVYLLFPLATGSSDWISGGRKEGGRGSREWGNNPADATTRGGNDPTARLELPRRGNIVENTQTAPSGSRYLLKEPSRRREGEARVTGPR